MFRIKHNIIKFELSTIDKNVFLDSVCIILLISAVCPLISLTFLLNYLKGSYEIED